MVVDLRGRWHVVMVGGALVAMSGLLAPTADGANSAAARARSAKVRKAFAVLRRHKVRRDTIHLPVASRTRRARAAALDSRLVYDAGADLRVYLVLDGGRLCLERVSAANGYASSGCQDAVAVATGKELLYGSTIRPDKTIAFVVTVDGSRDARLVPAIGLPVALAIRNNVIVRELTAPSAISWIGADGTLNSTVEMRTAV